MTGPCLGKYIAMPWSSMWTSIFKVEWITVIKAFCYKRCFHSSSYQILVSSKLSADNKIAEREVHTHSCVCAHRGTDP